MPDQTSLGLTLGADAEMNENWEKVNAALVSLGVKQVIPGDTVIQGNLEVQGTGSFAGPVSTPSIQAGLLTVTDTADIYNASVSNLVVHSTVALPAGSLAGTALVPGDSIQTVAVGTAFSGSTTLVAGQPTAVAVVNLDAAEELTRWQIVFLQATFQISYGTQAAGIVLALEMRRGPTTVVQTRQLEYYTSVPIQGVDIDIPVTMVRITKPQDAAHQWSLWATATYQNQGLAMMKFGQAHVIQFR